MTVSLIKSALSIRGACYFTTGVYNILVPLAIYQLTGSLALSGFFLFLEGCLKFAAYLYGGSLMKLVTSADTHLYIEIGRWLSVPLFALVYWYQGPWWGIAIASMLNQVANAFSNLLYEPRISRWGAGSPTAYAKQLNMDLLSNLVATLLTVALSVFGILLVTFFVQSYAVYLIYRDRSLLYQVDMEQEAARPPVSLGAWCKSEVFRPVHSLVSLSRPLWGVAFLSMALMWPIAIIFCNIPFFLEAGWGHTVSKDDVAWFTLLRTLVGYCTLRWVIKQTDKDSWVSLYGTQIWLAILLVTLIPISFAIGWWYSVVLLVYNAMVYLLIPKVRGLRQANMPSDGNKEALTGFMIAVDSSLYIVASAALATGISIHQAYMLTYVGSALFLMMALFLLWPTQHLAIKSLFQIKKVEHRA